MYKGRDFHKFYLRRTKSGKYVWMQCLRETAELYGWNKAFPLLIKQKFEDSQSGFISCPSRRGYKTEGGTEIRISRSPKTQGWPRGMTNAFRVSSDATLLDLAEVAQAVEVDWEWMTCIHGGRRTRTWWHETAISRGIPTRRAQAAG